MPKSALNQIQFWRGWNLALQAVWQGLVNVPEGELTADQQAFRQAVLGTVGNLFPNDELLKPKLTNAQLAARYGIAPRTVTNWRKQGCPLEEGKWAVWSWLRGQRIIPAGARVNFARLMERRGESDELAALEEAGKALRRDVREAKHLGLL